MRMTISNDEINKILNEKVEEIFNQKDFDTISDFEKRRTIYLYLVNNNDYDFKLLNDILNKQRRYYAEEVLAPLKGKNGQTNERGKGVCNGISYAYKLLLEQVGIKSMLVFGNIKCNDVEFLKKEGVDTRNVNYNNGAYFVEHMFILVENSDGTFSFDDPTCEILHRNEGVSYFNYDDIGCKYRNQVNIEGVPSDILDYIIERNCTKDDSEINSIYKSPSGNGMLALPKNIQKFEQHQNRENQPNR